MMDEPCIEGTRITVQLVLRKLGAGRTFADLMDAYPHLTEDGFAGRDGICRGLYGAETDTPVD